MTSVCLMLEIAKKAVEDGFAELVKSQYEAAFNAMAGGQSLEKAAANFERSLVTIKALRLAAEVSIDRVFV